MNKSQINQNEPIAAIATAVGEAGIAVIRVSGSRALEKVSKVFSGKPLADQKSHTIHYGTISEKGTSIDDVLISVFKSPNSYTGEDTAEISCHGGALVTQRVLEAILRQDIRHAEPGEFTHRAFINGKLELSQAEAVADLIHARSGKAVESARQQLDGALGEHIRQFRQQIIDATAMVELELDFIEEDVEFASRDELRRLLSELEAEIDKLLATYETGRLVKHGVRTVFVGQPNAGKSTLLNTLMGKDRAIVSATAGTTRDVIDADWSYDGMLFTLTDTAGLRITDDEIEAEGVKRSQKAVDEADLVVFLHDLADEDRQHRTRLEGLLDLPEEKPVIRIGTKADLVEEQSRPDLDMVISSVQQEGIDELKSMMKERVVKEESIDTSGLMVTSTRHRDALEKARHHIRESLNALDSGMTGDFLSIDLRSALNQLGTITGEITTEDVLDSIFSRFCIGK